MKKTLLLPFLAGLLLALPLAAQGPAEGGQDGGNNTEQSEGDEDTESKAEESEGPRRFWQASLPGGHYMVAIDRIASISMHQYVLDANLLVDEVVVDTNGRGLARFYYVTSVAEASGSAAAGRVVAKGRELLDRAGQRAGTDVHELAQKNYPTTSHAGMIEYRILDRRDLEELYKSLKNAWETGKGRKLTVK
jgi:hypothetical protein